VHDKAAELGADSARIRVLPHGVERTGAARDPASPLPERFVLYVGRLSEEKGVHALPALAMRIQPIPLLVAGGGPLEEWLRRRDAGNLRLLGHLAEDALAAVRERARVVIVPSLFPETFGYAVAEAQLDARAVVASRIGALGELIAHEVTGLLVPPGDGVALADATNRALADPAARAWGEAAQARAQTAFAPAAHAHGLVRIYEEAVRA